MLTAQGVRWVADITHAYRKKHNELCTQARIQTDRERERDYESCRCVRQIRLLGAHNIASRVSKLVFYAQSTGAAISGRYS